MRAVILGLLLVVGCGGPTQNQLAETPSAKARARPVEAPPANTADRDRYGLTQSFDDMQTTQQAEREAKGTQKAPPKAAGAGSGSATPGAKPKKKGPAEQAYLPK